MKRNVSAWFVYRQVAEIGFVIAIPLVIFVFLGHWLDMKLGFNALFVLISLPMSGVLSGYIIYKKIKSIE